MRTVARIAPIDEWRRLRHFIVDLTVNWGNKEGNLYFSEGDLRVTVPEPVTYALMSGLLAFILIALHQRRRAV